MVADGKVFPNLLQALLHKSMTPTQLMRKGLEQGGSYAAASAPTGLLRATELVDEAYFIMAGVEADQGGVVTRARRDAVDMWTLKGSDPKVPSPSCADLSRSATTRPQPRSEVGSCVSQGWYRLQTNYDHWNPVPKADDRRTPGDAHMDQLGEANLSHDTLFGLMTKEPTYNSHTDYTAVMEPATGYYRSGVWL